MTTIKIAHLTNRPRKDGAKRYYWQPSRALMKAGWKLTALGDNEYDAITKAREINAQVDEWRAGNLKKPTTTMRGTMNALIEQYKNSEDYLSKREKTRRDYDYYLALISSWAGDKQATSINKKMVSTLYEITAKKKKRKATYIIQVLRLLFSYAERQSIIPQNSNPATEMRLSTKTDKGHIWSPHDVTLFAKTADDMGYYSVGTAVILNEWMGQRMGDIITMRTGQYKDGTIHIKQSKTGAEVTIPVATIPHLKARIDDQIKRNNARRVTSTFIIEQENGMPFTVDGLSHIIAKVRARAMEVMTEAEAANFSKLIFKNLRHTAVTRLAEAGCAIPEIAAISGHTFKSCQDIIDRYNVRTKKMAQNAFDKRNQHKEQQ